VYSTGGKKLRAGSRCEREVQGHPAVLRACQDIKRGSGAETVAAKTAAKKAAKKVAAKKAAVKKVAKKVAKKVTKRATAAKKAAGGFMKRVRKAVASVRAKL
jgi:hypothetical protein